MMVTVVVDRQLQSCVAVMLKVIGARSWKWVHVVTEVGARGDESGCTWLHVVLGCDDRA